MCLGALPPFTQAAVLAHSLPPAVQRSLTVSSSVTRPAHPKSKNRLGGDGIGCSDNESVCENVEFVTAGTFS